MNMYEYSRSACKLTDCFLSDPVPVLEGVDEDVSLPAVPAEEEEEEKKKEEEEEAAATPPHPERRVRPRRQKL